MNGILKIDQTDRKIIEILQSNGKITNAKLSEKIGLSPAPTLERVKKLEQNGLIESYHAQVDMDKIGVGVKTFVKVSLKGINKTNIETFLDKIKEIDEVIECHHTTGSGDFMLKVVAKDINAYQKVMLDKVSEIEVVDSLQSMVILSTLKNSKVIPFPH
ncbi:Lrp/AsnC family transcriptional regulator [Reichenbachiella versicolor]|uniref:Lrp/AsnC family transcriptional regulator n=1 Tax=Reichenbachiella versicolor TaxID=1821036 RepID=UPI000D6E33A0|nr:Lrp/AsnC family transcriptional regulator [Reichenbachiella versicolor]